MEILNEILNFGFHYFIGFLAIIIHYGMIALPIIKNNEWSFETFKDKNTQRIVWTFSMLFLFLLATTLIPELIGSNALPISFNEFSKLGIFIFAGALSVFTKPILKNSKDEK